MTTPLTTPPLTDATINARSLNESLTRITERVVGRNLAPTIERLARLLGGEYFEAALGPTGDTRIRHSLQRIPTAVVLSVPLDVAAVGSEVLGLAAGGAAANGGNDEPWTVEYLYVRATSLATGTYAFVVI